MMRFEAEFQPTFRSRDEVVWVNPDKTATYTTEELAAHLIDLFVEHVQREINSQSDGDAKEVLNNQQKATEFKNPLDKIRRTYTKPPASHSEWP